MDCGQQLIDEIRSIVFGVGQQLLLNGYFRVLWKKSL